MGTAQAGHPPQFNLLKNGGDKLNAGARYLQQARKRFSLEAATRIRLHVAPVNTRLQPMDEPSRRERAGKLDGVLTEPDAETERVYWAIKTPALAASIAA